MTFEQLVQSETPVLVDFFATWCGPCKTMVPVLEQIKSEWGDQIRIVKIDVDKNIDLAVAQKVMGVPTFALFRAGRELWRKAGTFTAPQLQQILQQHL